MNPQLERTDMHCCRARGRIDIGAGRPQFVQTIISLLTLLSLSCGGPFMGGGPQVQMVLTSEKLLEIHEDVRFTRFIYADGQIESGLLLNWMPDSIRIQERGQGSPRTIPAVGLARIETITGNRMFEGFGIGVLVGAVYFLAVGGYNLGAVTFGEAMIKLLVPPAIVITGMAVGAGRDKTETFEVPPNFLFNYEEVRAIYRQRR
jgi:hypothetical protein